MIQRCLDYFLITDILQENVKNVDVIPAICTDHSSIMLRFSNLEKYNRGPSYWKFNNALLSDTMYINSMKEKIDEFCHMNFFRDDPRLNWEFMKFKIKEFTRKYSSEKKKKDVAERSDLEHKLKNLSHILNANSSDETRKEYEDCKNRLESFYDNITKGLILRSKAEWYEKSKRSNKYFYNLEKSNKSKTHVHSLIIDNTETHDQVTIMRKLNTYYSSLYARKSIKTEKECLDYLADINAPILTNEEQHLCEGQLMSVEVFDALSNMQADKTPGNDGLSKEFYLAFFDILCPNLLKCLNHAFEVGEPSMSQRQAVITLIEKKGKDKRYMKTWRPISLLNVDAKILSKILASHVKK